MWEEDGATNWYPQLGRLQRLRLLQMMNRTKGAWFLERGLMAGLTCVLMHACGQLGNFSPSIHLVRTITVEGSLFLELVITMEGSLVLFLPGQITNQLSRHFQKEENPHSQVFPFIVDGQWTTL